MRKLTAIIPTFNEEENIKGAIDSVSFANEILIVDSFSTDNTIKIANKLADKILQREYKNSASQKNWAIPQAKNNWVLILDADERITKDLKQEIINTLTHEPKHDAFWIKRDNYFLGKKIRFSGWQGDKVIRLFKKDICKYEEKHVHAEIKTKGRVGSLKNKITHNTARKKSTYIKKLERYARWQAKDYAETTKNINKYHLIIKPCIRFIKHYIMQGGFLDGYYGLLISYYQSKAVKMRYKYLIKQRNDQRNK